MIAADERDTLVENRYPRPQLIRPGWTDLCGPWDLAFDDADDARQRGWAAGNAW